MIKQKEQKHFLKEWWCGCGLLNNAEDKSCMECGRDKTPKIERGCASILIDLSDGKIKVFHGNDKALLFEKDAFEGDWDKIWEAIKE